MVCCKICSLPFFAYVFFCIGFFGLFNIPSLVRQIINQKVVLRKGSLLYPFWRDLPLPVYQKFYFYNITNPKEVEGDGAKPILDEIGPFTYRIIASKDPYITNNNTITFDQTKTWFFDREKSVMDETATIYTINAPLVFTLNFLNKASPLAELLIKEFLKKVDHGFIVNKSIKELTFLGYKDLLMAFAPTFAPKATAAFNGSFGYFHHKNGSKDGLFTVHSGLNDMSQINLLTRINGSEKLDIWDDEPENCNRFNDSSMGEIFPSLRAYPTRTVNIYTPDMSRSLALVYQESHYLFKNLETYKYGFSLDNFASSTDYLPNKCFKSEMTNYKFDGSNETLPSGVFDASTPNFGFPILMSLPHFYGADPYYLQKVDGLSPNESLHSTWIEIEPTSGATAATAVRLQLNIGIIDNYLFNSKHHMPNIVFPVFWMEVETLLTSDIVNLLVLANTMLSYAPILAFVISICISGFLLFIAFLRLIVNDHPRVKWLGCLGLLTCRLYQSIKDDEQTILDPDENADNEILTD